MMAINKSVWTWLREDNPRAYFKDENSLLVSYSFFPLRELKATKTALTKEAPIVKGYFVIFQDKNLFVPYRYNSPDIDAVDWGCYSKEYDMCFYYLAYYVYDNKTISISNKDNDVLGQFHRRELSLDGRRRRPVKKLKAKVEDILSVLGYSINSVAFVPEVKP